MNYMLKGNVSNYIFQMILSNPCILKGYLPFEMDTKDCKIGTCGIQ